MSSSATVKSSERLRLECCPIQNSTITIHGKGYRVIYQKKEASGRWKDHALPDTIQDKLKIVSSMDIIESRLDTNHPFKAKRHVQGDETVDPRFDGLNKIFTKNAQTSMQRSQTSSSIEHKATEKPLTPLPLA